MKKKPKQKPRKGWIYEHHEDGMIGNTFSLDGREWCLDKARYMYDWCELHEIKKAGRVRRVEVRIL